MDPISQHEQLLNQLTTAINSPKQEYTELRNLLIKHKIAIRNTGTLARALYDLVYTSLHSQALKIDLICTLAIHDIPFSDDQFERILKPFFEDMNFVRFWSYPAKSRFWELFDKWIAEPGKLQDYKALLEIAHDQKESSPWYKILAIPRQWKHRPYNVDTSTSRVKSLETLEARYQYWINHIDPRNTALRERESTGPRMQPVPSGWVPASLSGHLHLRR